MKNKNIIIYLLLSIIVALIVLYVHERQYRSLFWEMVSEQYSLSKYKSYRSGEDLIYHGLSKDSVLKMLPEPKFDGVMKLDSSVTSIITDFWYYRYFAEKYLQSKYDTIEVNVLEFRIPYHEIPNLYLGLTKKDGVWVVEHGVQWNDNTFVD